MAIVLLENDKVAVWLEDSPLPKSLCDPEVIPEVEPTQVDGLILSDGM